ncbi:MAG: hypothetical protein J6B63_03075, partial [Treponema sp.]|nr:hypothetical protein [Treponema sp.]
HNCHSPDCIKEKRNIECMVKNISRKKIKDFGEYAEDYRFWNFSHFLKHKAIINTFVYSFHANSI